MEQNNKIISIIKQLLCLITVVMIIILFIFFISNTDNQLKLYFLSIENSDASIIKYKDITIMIDTGEEKDEKIIRETMNKLKIGKINYLILSHPDKDHIGNAKYIIENYLVEKIFQTDYIKNSETQEKLNKVILEKEIENVVVKEQYNIEIDKLNISIYPPEKFYNDSNNNSLITLLEFNNHKALYTGDIEEERTKDILKYLKKVDLLKMPHHGRKNSQSIELIKSTMPEMTIITGKKIEQDILQMLNEVNSKIRLTSSDKTIEIIFK